MHRDLKPENIMVDDNDHIKLIDFGIASDSASRRLTYANFTATLGTPNYIAPEQVKGKRGDARTDIYSMGVILYEMLTGKLPFSGPSPLAAMNDRLLNHPVPPRVADPSISPQLQEILYRALERDPRNRYATRPGFLARPSSILTRSALKTAPSCATGKNARRSFPARILYYCALALIPVVILLLMILIAHAPLTRVFHTLGSQIFTDSLCPGALGFLESLAPDPTCTETVPAPACSAAPERAQGPQLFSVLNIAHSAARAGGARTAGAVPQTLQEYKPVDDSSLRLPQFGSTSTMKPVLEIHSKKRKEK